LLKCYVLPQDVYMLSISYNFRFGDEADISYQKWQMIC
jgi:hypothetical protein